MDLHLTDARPTDAEVAAVNGLLGPPQTSWEGGTRAPADFHVAIDRGYHDAASRRHMLLPALSALQAEIGWISAGGLNYIAERLTVPPAEAFGVASFYEMLATEERPPKVVHVCDDIACGAAGAESLIARLEEAASGDPAVAVERSPCLGQCDRAPAVMLQYAGEGLGVTAPASGVDIDFAAPPASSTSEAFVGDGGTRRLLRRVGVVDPTSLSAYQDSGGYDALRRAVEMGPEAVVEEIKASGIRGRGGAAFPMGIKWDAVASSPVATRYIVCNADESEPGTFKDRILLEDDPFAIVEAMTIAGLAIGAEKGFVYIRGEYPLGTERVSEAIAAAIGAGLLGDDVAGSGSSFHLEVRTGAGAYICGEETALFNSIEGYRGEPRNKPPFPTQAGLFGKPTVVNNVETLANVPAIVLEGGAAYADIGTADSTGPKLFCLSGAVARPGVYEVEFGATLGDLVDLAGGFSDDVAAILLGGAAGSFVLSDMLDLPLTFEATREAGVSLGSGVIMPFAVGTDFDVVIRRIASFFRHESCGQCVPCRVGTIRQEESLARLGNGAGPAEREAELALLADLNQVMKDASICGLGQTAGVAVESAIKLQLVGGGS